jgi:iron complex transport system substrate-binding protein
MKSWLAPSLVLVLALGSLAAASKAPGEVDLGRGEFRTRSGEPAHVAASVSCESLGDAERSSGKVVSSALLSDELLLEFLPRERLGGVSYVVDSEGSTPDRGRFPHDVPRVSGSAEEVLLLRPAMVVVSDYTSGAAEAQLSAAGLCVLRLRAPSTFDDLFTEALELGQASASGARAAAFVAKHRARLTALASLPPPSRKMRALLVQDPYAYGPGTLQSDCLKYTGLENALDADFGKTPTLGVEQLLDLETDLVFLATDTPEPQPLREQRRPRGAGWSSILRAGRAFEIPSTWMASISHHAILACESYARLAREVP